MLKKVFKIENWLIILINHFIKFSCASVNLTFKIAKSLKKVIVMIDANWFKNVCQESWMKFYWIKTSSIRSPTTTATVSIVKLLLKAPRYRSVALSYDLHSPVSVSIAKSTSCPEPIKKQIPHRKRGGEAYGIWCCYRRFWKKNFICFCKYYFINISDNMLYL